MLIVFFGKNISFKFINTKKRTDRLCIDKKDLTLVDGITHDADHSFHRLIVLYHPVDEGEG
jgi:hypothetical protein